MEESVAASVALGVPSRAVAVAQDADPFLSKLGGEPVWHDALTAPRAVPSCGSCGRPLLLIAQVYAPVDNARSLYLFGCNDNVCALKSDGWLVIRNQLTQAVEKQTVVEDTTAANEAKQASRCADVAENSWELDDSDEEGGDIDLNAMLAARDKTLTALPPTTTKNDTTASSEIEETSNPAGTEQVQIKAARMELQQHFPAVAVEIFDEPHEEEPEDGFTDDDLMAKFSEYMKQAGEDEDSTSLGALQAALQQAREQRAKLEDNDNDDDDDDEELTKRQQKQQAQDADEERYEALPPHVRRLLHFQKRVKRSPTQVLRYAWAEQPLWFAPLSPKYSTLSNHGSIPKCSCGQAREFELQLMPHTLSVLPIEEFTVDSSEAKIGEGASKKAGQLGKGMDWGTVIVYSCSASCNESNKEFAVIQWSQ